MVDSLLPPEFPQNVALLSALLGLQTNPGNGIDPSRERQDSIFNDNWIFCQGFRAKFEGRFEKYGAVC